MTFLALDLEIDRPHVDEWAQGLGLAEIWTAVRRRAAGG